MATPRADNALAHLGAAEDSTSKPEAGSTRLGVKACDITFQKRQAKVWLYGTLIGRK
jgi:hypothetical protein